MPDEGFLTCARDLRRYVGRETWRTGWRNYDGSTTTGPCIEQTSLPHGPAARSVRYELTDATRRITTNRLEGSNTVLGRRVGYGDGRGPLRSKQDLGSRA